MSTLSVPPPILRRSVVEGPPQLPFRIYSGGQPVGLIRAETRDAALVAFTRGRPPMPDGAAPLVAYSIEELRKATTR